MLLFRFELRRYEFLRSMYPETFYHHSRQCHHISRSPHVTFCVSMYLCDIEQLVDEIEQHVRLSHYGVISLLSLRVALLLLHATCLTVNNGERGAELMGKVGIELLSFVIHQSHLTVLL